MRPFMPMRSQGGFTLIEVVMAFALLAVGLGAVMQIAVGAMHQSRQATDYTEVALHAQSLLDTVGVGERLEEGSDAGRFGERYDWQLFVSPYEVPSETAMDPSTVPVTLYRVDLVIHWERGRHQHEARFSTLRALVSQ